MSSPSVIVVVVTHVPSDSCVKEVAEKHRATWLAGLERERKECYPNDPPLERLYHTDQAVDDFLKRLSRGECWIDGSQGSVVTWGYCGNYVNPEEFVEA